MLSVMNESKNVNINIIIYCGSNLGSCLCLTTVRLVTYFFLDVDFFLLLTSVFNQIWWKRCMSMYSVAVIIGYRMWTLCGYSNGYLIVVKLMLFAVIVKFTASAPVNENDISINFDDNWNYETPLHNEPLLSNNGKAFLLPAFYQYSRDLKIEPLVVKEALVDTRSPKKIGSVVRATVPCGVCKLGIGLLRTELLKGTSFDDIKIKFVSLCTTFKIATDIVCTGFFNVYGPEVLPAFNSSGLGAAETCSLIFGETCGDVDNSLHEWQVSLPSKREAKSLNIKQVKLDGPVFKVLHLSDTHFDPQYAVGSPANCEEPLCCRQYSTPSSKEETIFSGRWGAYEKCDSPRILIENMLKNIAIEHPDIDYILWTGDLPPHDIWNQTKSSNLDIIQTTVEQMFHYFPNIPIFPAIGNHESAPAGSFAPPWMHNQNHSIDWLYTKMADHWRKWLPSTSGNTVLHGAFYSVLLRPGFRLISLNTNYCHNLNWWLLVNSTDPAKELKWLVRELQLAEDNNEKVHLIGHIPPGSSDCMKTWSKNFYAIVERYQDTIRAQFYGHSHADEFELFYDTREYSKRLSLDMRWRFWRDRDRSHMKFTGKAIGVAYLGPSVTTYENHNPAYRIYYVDGDHEESTRDVLDHETWTIDLAKANEGINEPFWFKLYSAKDAYQMTSLSPAEWNRLVERMVDDQELFDQFYRNYYRDSPTIPSCDTVCKMQILCDLKSGKSHDRHHLCHELELGV